MIKLLSDRQVQNSPDLLDIAWKDPLTFAFVADRSGASSSWIEKALALLPKELHYGHFVLLTSGTTGQPKLVVGSKSRAESLANLLHQLQDSEPVEVALGVLPLTYSYAFVNQWLWARVRGRRLRMTEGFGRPDRLERTLLESKAAQLCLVKAHVSFFQKLFVGKTFPGVIRIHFAGGPFPQESLGFLRSLFPMAHIFNNYGCTEAMPRLTLRRAEDGESANDVGKPLPGVLLKTTDQGELLFQSSYGAVAVIDNGGFHAVNEGAWMTTGDLAEIDSLGHWHILGRNADVFKRYGEKVSLWLLQQSISAVWQGQCSFYLETDSQGELGAILILAPHPSLEAARRILQTIRDHHPRVQWPLRLESVEALPLLSNAKVDVEGLPRLVAKKVHWYHRL